MKKKTYKKILNAQMKLAGHRGYRYVSKKRVFRVDKYVMSHYGNFRFPIETMLMYIDDGSIKADGTIFVGKAKSKSVLYTDC